jgi:hypothetical protein
MWSYPEEFLRSLADFGLAPASSTPPQLVRDAVADLYRYELRRLRDRLRAGVIEKAGYHDAVIAVRKRYWLLTLSERAWEDICAASSAG